MIVNHPPLGPMTSLSDLTPDLWKKSNLADPFFHDESQGVDRNAYVEEIIKAAIKTGATHIRNLGGGREAMAYELFRNGNPMWVVLRVHRNGIMHAKAKATLPFYSDEVISLPESERHFQKRSVHNVHSGYPGSMRITIMPKVIQDKPVIDEYGNVLDGITKEDLDHAEYMEKVTGFLMKSQGYFYVENHPGNIGHYRLVNGENIPVVFDPGPAMENESSMYLLSASEKEIRASYEARRLMEKFPWKDDVWDKLRAEIREDAHRLFNGKDTSYSIRMNSWQQGSEVPRNLVNAVNVVTKDTTSSIGAATKIPG
jgi:hypothetical protein